MLFLILDTLEDEILAEKLYNRYSKFMFKVSYSILKENTASEDAVHLSFIKIMKNSEPLPHGLKNL